MGKNDEIVFEIIAWVFSLAAGIVIGTVAIMIPPVGIGLVAAVLVILFYQKD